MTSNEDVLAEETGRIRLSDHDDGDGDKDDTLSLFPAVDHEVCVVENKGIKISYDYDAGNKLKFLGRVTIATRSFERLYVPILREKPAIVCRSSDYMDYMEQFLQCPEEVQIGILDCFHQSLEESTMGKSLVEPAKLLFLLGVLDDFTLIHKLLSIYATNAHQYKENSSSDDADDTDTDTSALPIFGSKLPHSCTGGNVGYASHAPDGCVEYMVIKPIENGDIVSFTYLTDLFETPTPERRQILFDTKHFMCQCERCNGPDYCRFIKCPMCCSEFIACRYNKPEENLDDPLWMCPSCGPDLDNDTMLVLERQMAQTLKIIERSVQKLNNSNFNKIPEFSVADLGELLEECCDTLSPVHYLTIKALRLLITVCAISAYVQTKRLAIRGGWSLNNNTNNPRVLTLHRSGIEASFRLIAACECVAAGCPGCTPLVLLGEAASSYTATTITALLQHAPLYDRATPVHRVYEELVQNLPPHYWPSYTLTIFNRYLPLLHVKFGHIAIDEIETKLLPWNQAICLECGTFWSGTPPPSSSVQTKPH